MLYNWGYTFHYLRFCQSGLYLDFWAKRISESFLRYVLIYGSIFFLEKYLVEHLTKIVMQVVFFKFGKEWLKANLSPLTFFYQLTSIIFLLITLAGFFACF